MPGDQRQPTGLSSDPMNERPWRLRPSKDPDSTAREGRDSGAQLVEHAAQAEQVGAMVDRHPGGLLGGHEAERPAEHTALGQRPLIGNAGQPKVGEHHPLHAVLEQDVLRLDVTVDQALRTCAAASPAAACEPIRRIAATSRIPSRRSRSASVMPEMYSMTK